MLHICYYYASSCANKAILNVSSDKRTKAAFNLRGFRSFSCFILFDSLRGDERRNIRIPFLWYSKPLALKAKCCQAKNKFTGFPSADSKSLFAHLSIMSYEFNTEHADNLKEQLPFKFLRFRWGF